MKKTIIDHTNYDEMVELLKNHNIKVNHVGAGKHHIVLIIPCETTVYELRTVEDVKKFIKMQNETILFLGPEKSPLLTWLIDHEVVNHRNMVLQTSAKITSATIDNNNITWLISYGYRHILTKEVLDKLPDRAINLHISYLPFNRGADPNFWSFINNTPKGVTIHYMDTGVDTGDIIAQRQVVFTEETLVTTYQRLQTEIQELFKENWASIKAGTCGRTKQSHRAADKNVFSQLLQSGWDTDVSVVAAERQFK